MAAPTFDEFAARASAKYPEATEAQIREAYQVKYGRTPVRTRGPSRDEFAARARAKYPDVSDSQIAEAYEAKYGADFLTETKRTLASQVVAPTARGLGAIAGGFDRLLGGVPGTGLFDQAGEALFNYGQEVARQNAPSADLQNRSLLAPARLGQNIIGAGGQILAALGTGGGSLAPLAADEAGGLTTELEREGMDPEEARLRGSLYGLASAALERVGLGRLMPTRMPGRIKAGLLEGSTEVGQNITRNVVSGDPALEGFGESVYGEGLPAGIVAAAIAPGGRRRGASQAEEFARQAGLEEGAAQEATQVAPDRAGPEPLRDLEAQAAEVGRTRRGVYVSPGNRGFTAPGLVPLETPDGGTLLVREQDAQEAQAALAGAQDDATRQAVIGEWTGAGAGKPLDPNARVVQAIRNGAVIRETAVPPEEAQATAKRMAAELKVQTRVVTPAEALARRARIIENEDQSPFKALGEEELLRRTDPAAFEQRIRDRPIPPRSEIPREVERLFETPEGSTLVPIGELTPTKERRTVSGALKFMQATAKGERPKRAPLSVKVDGTGTLRVEDGNGTLAAARFLKFDALPANIELTTTTPKGREYERRLAPEARVELARLARDAEAYLPQFRETLQGIAETVTGARVSNQKTVGALVPNIKSNGKKAWDRIAEKVVAEDGGDWRKLKDMARATILVENKAQAEQALEAVIQAFGQAPGTNIRRSLLDAQSFEDVVAMDPYGYGDIKVNVNGPNGRVYEVQITTPDLFDAKENGPGHSLYETGRKREGEVRDLLRKRMTERMTTADPDAVLAAVDRAVAMFRERDPEMQRLFRESRKAYGQAWDRFFASSAQSSRQAASEMASPSALTDEGVTGMNTPSGPALNATSPDTTAGAPSTLKNSLSSTASSSIDRGIVATTVAPYNLATPSGRVIQVRPKFVELDSLITSDFPDYPARFQPRERGERAALTEQVRKIARELKPWLLGTSRSTEDGASIVDQANLVESGNGRTLALRLARERHPENYAAYQEWVRQEAASMGVDVSGMENPVLVQERVTPLSDEELVAFTIDANRSGKAAMSPTELAKADSTLLDEEMLTALRSGDLSQAQNAEFVARFVSKLPDRQGLSDRTGARNAEAIRRAEAAMVAKAYGAERPEVSLLLDRLYETQDEGVRRITNALKLAAFKWSELRLGLESGRVEPSYDLSGELMLAYNQVREGRLRGLTPEQIRAQGDLTMTPERAAFIDAFYKADGKEQPTEVIAAQLIYTAQQAAAQRADQTGLFDDRIAPADIVRNAVELIGRNETRADIGKDGTFQASRTWPKPGGVQAWAVTQTLARMMDAWNPDIMPFFRVVQSAGELPQNVLAALGPGINGATDLDKGVVYLVADNLTSMHDAERVIVHEVVGHYGFMRLWGERWPKLVEDVIRLSEQDGSIRRVKEDILRRYPKDMPRDHLAAEIVAHVAETRPKHPFTKRIIAQFRELLRKLGFKINLSRSDLVHLIRKAADALKDPRGPGYKGPRDRNITYRSPRNDRYLAHQEAERDLIAQHNLTADKLRFVLKSAGGYLRVPSIAVTKAKTPIRGFGDITLLGDAELIDPRGKHRTKVFGADIYSPRYPTVKKFLQRRQLVQEMHDLFRLPSQIYSDVELAIDNFMSGDMDLDQAAEFAGKSPGGWALMALEKGYTPKEIMAAHEAANSDPRYENASPADRRMIGIERVAQMIADRTEGADDPDALQRMVIENMRKRIERLPFREKIFKGYDMGVPRYAEHTLENVIKLMKRNLRGGETGKISYGTGQIRAMVAPQFSSRRQITANKGKLVDKADFALAKKEAEDLMLNIASDVFGNDFGALQNAADFLADVARGGIPFARSKLRQYGIEHTWETVRTPGGNMTAEEAVKKLMGMLREMPTEYFEAKVLGAVPLSDFKAAVVPGDLDPELKRALESRGIRVFEYDNDRRSARQDAIERATREVESTLFASRLDQQGRPIPEGQQDLPELDTGERQEQQAPDFALERPEGQVSPPAQGRLFASRPATIPGTPTTPPEGPVEAGGGTYSLSQYGKLSDKEMHVLRSAMTHFEGAIEEQRGGREPQTWDATERAALNMIRNQTGLVLDSLIKRKPGTAANAAQLEAYAQMIVRLNQEITAAAQKVADSRNPSSADLARVMELREKLGMMLAPAMGYATEAGRALNILRKVAGDLRTADDILAQLGDGSENAIKDFSKRIVDAGGDVNKVLGVTRASYTPTWWDKFYEYWINGLLSGPTTHSVNIVSNAIFDVLERVTEVAASLSGQVPLRSAAARAAAVPHGITVGLTNAKTAFLEERAVLTPEDKLETDQRAIGGTLGKIVRLPGRALQAEDEFFKAIAYHGTLSALAMDEAVRTNPGDPMGEHARIMGNILSRPDLIKKAKDQAARLTFTTPLGPIGQAVTAALNKSKVGRLIVPFVRTPTNILKRALEYTPAAPIFAQVRADLMGGGRDQAMAWSRMAVGSSIMMGVAMLAAQGILSGAGPDDESERAQLMRQGWRPYSIKVPGIGWVKYNRFEPVGMLLGLGADLSEMSGVLSEGEYEAVASMLVTSLATNLGDKTFLRGISDFAAAYSDPKRYMERWANGLITSPIPNVVGQTARWLDPYQREANGILENARAKIPGASKALAQRLDLAGDPIKRDSGAPGNPFQTSQPREDILARTMLELGVRKNAVSRNLTVNGSTFELRGEAFESYKRYVQKARWNVLTPLVNSPQFRQLRQQNPLAAQALLERQYDEIGRQARMAWIFQNPGFLTEPKQQRRAPTSLGYELN